MKRRHVVLALLCVLAAITYLDRICISVALPRIQNELRIRPERLGWVSVAFSLSYAAFEIPSGHMADRTGPRRVLTRVVGWWSAFTALTGAATGFTSLLVTRFCFGAGEAGSFPSASAAVSRWFPYRSRGAAMGAVGAASTVGGALSPLLVIPIQQRYGWRASFYVFAVLGVAWAAVWYAWFRDSPAEKRGVTAAERGELAGAPPAPEHGMPWSVALRSRNLQGLLLTWFGGVYVAFFAVFWLPTYLVKARGFTEADLRWLSVLWIAGMIGNLGGGLASDALSARLGRTRGRRFIALAGTGCHAAAHVALAFTHAKAPVVALLAVIGALTGVVQANILAVCIDVGRSHAGTVTGATNTTGQVGGALSAVAFGYLVKTTGSYDVPVLVMAGVAALSALPWLFIDASRGVLEDAAA